MQNLKYLACLLCKNSIALKKKISKITEGYFLEPEDESVSSYIMYLCTYHLTENTILSKQTHYDIGICSMGNSNSTILSFSTDT